MKKVCKDDKVQTPAGEDGGQKRHRDDVGKRRNTSLTADLCLLLQTVHGLFAHMACDSPEEMGHKETHSQHNEL